MGTQCTLNLELGPNRHSNRYRLNSCDLHRYILGNPVPFDHGILHFHAQACYRNPETGHHADGWKDTHSGFSSLQAPLVLAVVQIRVEGVAPS